MIDRIPTMVLGNGAIRYAIYDEAGNFLRYEYILKDDLPTQTGTPYSKSAVLDDTTSQAFGGAQTPNEALAMASTVATAVIEGGSLVITSLATRVGEQYLLQFVAPEAYTPRRVFIDGTEMDNIFDCTGAAIKAGTWAYGVIVVLAKLGTGAYVIGGGSSEALDEHIINTDNPHAVTRAQIGLSAVTNTAQMPLAGGTFTGNAIAYATDRSSNCLRNIQVQNSGGNVISTSWVRMRR